MISGSFALSLKEKGFAKHIIGVSRTEASAKKALELGIIDEALPLEEAVKQSDFIYVAIPVDVTIPVMQQIMDMMMKSKLSRCRFNKICIVQSFGRSSDAETVCCNTSYVGNRIQWAEAAVRDAFVGRACVICDKEKSDHDAVEIVEQIYQALGMHIVYMDAEAHDVHAAYVSHISHITSFALANTVLEKEKEEDAIFELASAGFESTVRLAKSNPAMWVPIFMQNRENVLDVLNEHITQLRKFKACLEKENMNYLNELIENANKIKRIIK